MIACVACEMPRTSDSQRSLRLNAPIIACWFLAMKEWGDCVSDLLTDVEQRSAADRVSALTNHTLLSHRRHQCASRIEVMAEREPASAE
ncbi:MAG: hypothetical protein RL701_8032 [Pseudomonadota bacterium]